MGLLLFIVSGVLGWIVMPVGLLFGFFKQFYKKSFKEANRQLNVKFLNMAVSRDKYANVVCGELFNATLIKNSVHLFGNHRQTVSHVLGLNLQAGTLTITGRVANYFCNRFDRNHAIKSIDKTPA